MNEKLQNQLTKMLEWAERATSTGVEFVVEQTPLYIQELLVYNFWISLIYFLIGILILVGSMILFIKAISAMKKNDFWECSPFLTCFLLPIGMGVGLMKENTDWLKIKLAPRVYIIDYLRTELKK
jgi:hypothetical protein